MTWDRTSQNARGRVLWTAALVLALISAGAAGLWLYRDRARVAEAADPRTPAVAAPKPQVAEPVKASAAIAAEPPAAEMGSAAAPLPAALPAKLPEPAPAPAADLGAQNAKQVAPSPKSPQPLAAPVRPHPEPEVKPTTQPAPSSGRSISDFGGRR
jgi:hypothetical protein